MPDKKQVAVVGGTGFTGSELIRVLLHHPAVELVLVTSESSPGAPLSSVHPFLHDLTDLVLQPVSTIDQHDLDLVYLALPHGVSMEYVKQFADRAFRIVDLSGDFRLRSPKVYASWYKQTHTYPEGFAGAVYGLPELFGERIAVARLVANPGCYPTCAILGIAPLTGSGHIQPEGIIIDAKSGVTGAGVKARPGSHFSVVNENFKAYGIATHRHTIEIQEQLTALAGNNIVVQFTPHLLPLDRGILATTYVRPSTAVTGTELQELYADYYQSHPFVRVVGRPPGVKQVRGTNFCDVFVTLDERTNRIIVISVIDNLVKGAAGQAVQNMNLMLGLSEISGLQQIPLSP